MNIHDRAEQIVYNWYTSFPKVEGITGLIHVGHRGQLAVAIATALRDVVEECARVCDEMSQLENKPTDRIIGYMDCATAIRRLKEEG